MRALVTGATGFLGSHLVDACLARGDAVRALVRDSSDLTYLRSLSGVELVFGGLTDDGIARATQGVDVVYHSAARVLDYGSRAQFMETNVAATDRLLAGARANGARRFVLVSSPSVVAEDKDQIDIDESYPYPAQFLNLYSETKAIAEQRVLAANADGFITCAVRPRGIWGPRDWNGFLPKIVARLQAGKLRDMWGGKPVLGSICYATNAADACLLAARSDRVGGKTYFVADPAPIDIAHFDRVLAATFGVPPISKAIAPWVVRLAAEIAELLWKVPYLAHNHAPPVSRYAIGLLTRQATYDTRAAERDFGYRPTVTLDAGLAALRKWVDDIGGVDAFTKYVR